MIPVSLSGGVEPGARTGTSVGGQPVVVWRGADGHARAWADSCPHRGMRLSFGFVRRDQLTCIYHGWSFGEVPGDAKARCLSVPAHPDMPPPAKAFVTALPVAEALGMIWVGTAPGDTEPPRGAAALAAAVHPVRSVTVHAPATALRAALRGRPAARHRDRRDSRRPRRFRPAASSRSRARRRSSSPRSRTAVTARASAHIVSADADAAARKALCLWAALVRDHLAAVVLP